MGISKDEEEPGTMAEQLELLQEGKSASDLKLKTMEENIAKILAAIQPPSQPSQLPAIQPIQPQQNTPVGSFSQTSSSASTIDNSLLVNQPSPPQSVERQPQSGLPSCPASWSTTRTIISIPATNQPQPATDKPQPATDKSQPATDKPQHLQTILSHLQTILSQPQTSLSQPQTILTQPQTSLSQPQTSLSQPQTSLSHLQTILTQPQTSLSQPQTSLTQPQTSLSQLQTSNQLQTNYILLLS
jgi:hypothetical protein